MRGNKENTESIATRTLLVIDWRDDVISNPIGQGSRIVYQLRVDIGVTRPGISSERPQI